MPVILLPPPGSHALEVAGAPGTGRVFPSGGAGTARDMVVSWVESTCRTVLASDYGGATSGTLYACGQGP